MKDCILIIGEDLSLNEPLLNSALSAYKNNFNKLANINFANKNDKNLPFLIENLTMRYECLSIFVSNESYNITSKILATLNSDLLEAKENGELAPINCKKISKNSFLVTLNECEINLIKITPFKEIPEFLINFDKKSENFYIFDYDADSVKILLEPIASSFGVKISLTQYSKFLTLVSGKERKFGQLDEFIKGVKNLFSTKAIFEKNFLNFIVKQLKKSNKTITFAESCTGGLLASQICQISGASEVFKGSFVTYSDEIKNKWLGVDNEILKTKTAVSKECVESMLKGAIKNANANFALAVSGYAGPSGGDENNPVGTIFIGAIDDKENILVEKFLINADRNYTRNECVNIAFSLLLKLNKELFF